MQHQLPLGGVFGSLVLICKLLIFKEISEFLTLSRGALHGLNIANPMPLTEVLCLGGLRGISRGGAPCVGWSEVPEATFRIGSALGGFRYCVWEEGTMTESSDVAGAQSTGLTVTQGVDEAVQARIAAEDGVSPQETKASSPVNIEERLKRLEEGTDVEFIRREVRFIPATVNLWRYFRPFGSGDDVRSRAALTAFLWRLFSPGSAAAAGGIVMLGLTAAQVLLVSQQNQKLDQQTYLAEASRRGALTAEFAALSEKIGSERAQSVRDGAVTPWMRFKVDGVHFNLEESTLARLSAFTRTAKAYHYLDLEASAEPITTPTLGERWNRWITEATAQGGRQTPAPRLNLVPLSPERGLALSFLSTNTVDLTQASTWGLDFSQADLRYTQLFGTKAATLNLARSDLSDSTLLAVDLASADLRGVNLRGVCWQEGDMSGAKFKNADLRGAYINDVALPNGDQLGGVRIDSLSNLDGSYSFYPGWMEQAREHMHPESLSHLAKYKVVAETRTFVLHDYAGKASEPRERKIYVLKAASQPDRPPSCEFLPGA